MKVVYWNNIEKIHSTAFQEKLFRLIERGKEKLDFSPFDIYQYVDETKRNAFLEVQDVDGNYIEQDLVNLLLSAEKSLMIFSGNFSWWNLVQGKKRFVDILKELASKDVNIKIICNVDIVNMGEIMDVLAVNSLAGKECISVRHTKQPLRAFIVDDKLVRLKEIKNPKDYDKGKLKKKTFIFYEVFDEMWIEWMQKVFWNFYRGAISAEKRIKDIESIQKLT